jgi:hypothetical protein
MGVDHWERRNLTLFYPGGTVPISTVVEFITPAMGFASHRFRAKLKATTTVNELSGKPPIPERGLSLYDGDKLFGEENSWRRTSEVTSAYPLKGYVEFTLETE